jgi:uncharacterized protein
MKRRCPICKTPTDSEKHSEFPFCSERCRTQDLGNWASEKYVVSEPVFDADKLEADKEAAPKKRLDDEDEDFRGFPRPNGTIH